MGLHKLSLAIFFHVLVDHFGHLRRYICFTTSLLIMLYTLTVEARSRVPLCMRAWREGVPMCERRQGLASEDGWEREGHRCRPSCNRLGVFPSQIHLYIGVSIWHPLMENGRSL